MFLPVSKEDMITRNIKELDFIMIIGEAYVDHPSFGHAIVSRLFEYYGYSIGIIAQPQKDSDYQELGTPKYAFLISSGVIDSMVNNYTVSKKKRSKDVYSPGSKAGLRPDMATIVYTQKIKKLFPDSYTMIGSIEASLRRFSHYDYWQDKVLKPLIILSGADLLMYGMGENPIKDICKMLDKNVPIEKIRDVKGTMYATNNKIVVEKLMKKNDVIFLPSYEEVICDKKKYCKMHMLALENQDDVYGKYLIQKVDNTFVIQNPPQKPLETNHMDLVYNLPYERAYHPMYEAMGKVESINEVKFSLTSNRGCFGACNYCALTYHQGRKVQVRSHESIIKEAMILTHDKDFKGYIHDVGGPTANFRRAACDKQKKIGVCKSKQCLFPTPCTNLEVDHTDYISLLRKLRNLENVKKVFIRSGIRFDYLMYDKDQTFLKELCQNHISGQLKVAPEHSQNNVLDKMGKPHFETYLKFEKEYKKMNEILNKDQYLVPYFISSHPGCTLNDAIKLAEYLNSIHHMPEQVQDFYPTPGTISTCMYYTGIDPRDMSNVYIPKSKEEKTMQRALLQYRKKENYNIVKEALKKAGRTDLIGFSSECLIKPTKQEAILLKQGYKNNKNINIRKKVSTKFTKKK
ncbi:MAG: YgiQ family radical SAM protein [Clostridia bacterium]